MTFFVKRKLAPSRLLRSERIPKELRLQANPGVPITTDVVEVGDGFTLHSSDGVVDPLQPGAPLGHFRGIEGTLGVFVQKRGSADRFLLSCSHVLALSGAGRVGDPIEQPLVVNEDLDHVVGPLSSGFTVLDANAINSEDFALARVDVSILTTPLGAAIAPARVSPLDASQFEQGTLTVLRGAASNGAVGSVRSSASTFVLGGFTFAGLVLYRSTCHAGDSGAAVVSGDDESTLLGIHVGGNTQQRMGLFQPAGPLFARHGLTLA